MSSRKGGSSGFVLHRGARFCEIDLLKGVAILAVLLIHARPLVGSLVHTYLINRAVPIFLFLFGTTSQLWWHRHSRLSGSALREWYGARFRRLLVPMWGAFACWWTFKLVFVPAFELTLPRVIATVLGYAPWVGTAWFVTLILELVILYPIILYAVRLLGDSLALIGALSLMIITYVYAHQITDILQSLLMHSAGTGFFYLWIFPGDKILLVVSGMTLARHGVRLSAGRTGVFAAMAIIGVAFAEAATMDATSRLILMRALDIPLSIVLLALARFLGTWQPLERALTWCGVSSWGIYLGQMLVHNVATGLGTRPWALSIAERWLYAAALLIGAIGLVVLGSGCRALSKKEWLSFCWHS